MYKLITEAQNDVINCNERVHTVIMHVWLKLKFPCIFYLFIRHLLWQQAKSQAKFFVKVAPPVVPSELNICNPMLLLIHQEIYNVTCIAKMRKYNLSRSFKL